jgi:hypothetical protein
MLNYYYERRLFNSIMTQLNPHNQYSYDTFYYYLSSNVFFGFLKGFNMFFLSLPA